jgi:lipopolysaccharide export system protein LptC
MTERGQDHYLGSQPRRTVTLKGAQRRAVMARYSRVLFFVALVAIGLPVAWFLLRPEPQAEEPELAPVEPGETGVRRITSPRFTGFDTSGRAFEVLAQTAIQRPQGDTDLVELELPCFYDNQDTAAESRTSVCARGGMYDSGNRILDLNVDVNLETENGYTFSTSHARIFVDERRAEGDQPVRGSTASGTVSADRWSYQDDGAILHFEGNVRTVFNSEGGNQAAEDGAQ